MRNLSLLLLPCVIAAVVHLWWVTDKTAFFSDLKSAGSHNPVHEVLVGVLSARHHHDLREAIRDTWLGYLRDHPKFQNRSGFILAQRVLVKFIIGQHGCAIPEEDREDPYSCTPLNLTEPVARQDMAILSVPDASVLVLSDVSAISLDFKVLHSVVITQLGVFSGGAQQHFRGNVTVKLFQVDQEEAVVTASFTALSPGTYVEGIWYKAVEQFILPKGFEGTLLWESQDLTALMTLNVSKIQLNNGGGVLKLGCIEEGTLPHRSAVGFPGLAGGFTFSVYNVEVLKEMLRRQAGRQQAHVARLREEDKALQEESHRYGDMVFVDIVDTYRTVPSKLLQFYKWAIRNTDFNLLLKTDDDCYINVDAVLMKIDRKSLTRSSLWWGNFRQNWAVDRLGKWQELEYASPVYPAFACGSGYVVSRDLVVWLASNAEKLKAYQGEDVSMGIWMAAVGPNKYQKGAIVDLRQCGYILRTQAGCVRRNAMWTCCRHLSIQ
ncbi:UDP-GalNAc:beta-1,3-N-acetylgalactosaminyltransferase 2 isoform X6 [Colossoma macropomum]|uniref:UDP-GalNAc:beta-1, 3-N-acetylgalactosaminyltransferase 2 isoform X6 n=1 Tax=Colossoma macropomum TaxID=42526 RepID=UPI001863B8D2|nr:UDP-GalNAc:beta-1,3-N-acetylgalactosaminyltransferase 2 isoform X6 [Colossoma macropomum]